MDISPLGKRILFELDKDGRASLSDIARTLKTTPQVVRYHYSRLMEQGAVDKFWAFIDYDRAGYSFFWGYWIKFAGIPADLEHHMLEELRANRFIPIVMRCDGYADLFIAIIAKDVFAHNEILQGLFARYGAYIAMSELVVGLGFIKFPRTYLVREENAEKAEASSGGSTEEVKLAELDRKILSLLQEDGRMDFTKIAKITGTAPAVVQKHYHKLRRSGVISKITFTPNYAALGLQLYRVLLKIGQFNPERIEALHTYCAQHPHIINYVKVMGSWQLMLDVEIGSREALRELMREIRLTFPDIVFQLEVNEVYKVEKFTQMAIEYPGLAREATPQQPSDKPV